MSQKQGACVPDLTALRVRHFVGPGQETIHPDRDVAEARRHLARQSAQLLVVTDGSEIVGPLTPSKLDASSVGDDDPVRQTMNTHRAFCYGDDKADVALALLGELTSDHLLIVEPEGGLIGDHRDNEHEVRS